MSDERAIQLWKLLQTNDLFTAVRTEVEGCLLQFDRSRYDIDAFVLMPNHVHAIIKPMPGFHLSTVGTSTLRSCS